MARGPKHPPGKKQERDPKALTPNEALFVLEYRKDRNATRAYRTVYGCSQKSAEANGTRLIRKARVTAAIAELEADRAKALIMDGDEALQRISLYGRADIGKVLDPSDRLAQLPDEARLLIKTVRDTRYGRVIELHDALRASEIMAKAAGRLKEQHEHKHSVSIVDLLAPAQPAADAAK